MTSNYDRMGKTLISLAIEHCLLQIGRSTFEKVESQLRARYQLSITDCYEHPQYLNEILKETFGKSHTEVIKSIDSFLSEFRDERYIEEFMEKISH
ncbi:MAG: hypothetical protein ACREBB_08170 [Nitrosotalea sp.]